MKKYIFALLIIFTFITPVSAEINIVATLPWIGSIAKEIGNDKVNISVLVKPNHDPHYIEAKPSMTLAARRADIIMYNGLDLEIGYLPLIIESSRNPKIQAGKTGNLDCSRYIEPIEKPLSVDRSMGDVHPLGNPHYHLSPMNILKVAEGMADTLSKIDSINALAYRKNLSSFKERLRERQGEWNVKQLKGKKFIAYHRYFEYLAAEFRFSIIGYIEPKPGIPPSASHVEGLIEVVREGKPDAILFTGYGGKREVEFISQKTGVKGIVVPHDVGSHEGINDWFDLMDSILESIE
jgi:zinc/manganese transport system substrate-binding protein